MNPGQEPDIVEDGVEFLSDAPPEESSKGGSGAGGAEELLVIDDDTSSNRSSSLPVRYSSGGDVPETLTALNVYLAKLKDVEILPIEEQALLASEYQTTGSQDAAARLVASNLRLVVKIAFQFKRQ